MKIAHTEASCGWGGQEIRILEESMGLMARGHEIVILCPEESRIHIEAKRRSIATTALPIGKKRLSSLLALRRWLQENPVDVINTHSSTDTWLTALACKTLPTAPPVVRTRHISAPVPNNYASRWLYTKGVCQIVTTGEAIRKQLIEQTGVSSGHITSVPTGINPERFFPGDRSDARSGLGLNPTGNYIGIVATLRSWKGHLFLLDAMADPALQGWTLLVVGDGPMREPIMAKVLELGLGHRVLLIGQQDYPEIWLRALDIFVLPSYANEGVPQAILQAMFTALPIVTTSVGAILEAVCDGNTALVVEHKNSRALAQALGRVATDSRLRDRLGTAAYEAAITRFTHKTMLSQMEAVFQKVLS